MIGKIEKATTELNSASNVPLIDSPEIKARTRVPLSWFGCSVIFCTSGLIDWRHRRSFLLTAVPVIRAFRNHPQLEHQPFLQLTSLSNVHIQRFGTGVEHDDHHGFCLRFGKTARHMVFELQIVSKFRNEVLNFTGDRGTEGRRSAGTLT